MSSRGATFSARRLTAGLLLTGVALSACGGDPVRSAADYCVLVDRHLPALSNPTIEDQADVSATVSVYREIADAAPLAVEVEWQVMLDSVETAADVDPDDPESVQEAADAARRSQVAANVVIAYTQQQCGQTFGLPGNTTTVPPVAETPPPTG